MTTTHDGAGAPGESAWQGHRPSLWHSQLPGALTNLALGAWLLAIGAQRTQLPSGQDPIALGLPLLLTTAGFLLLFRGGYRLIRARATIRLFFTAKQQRLVLDERALTYHDGPRTVRVPRSSIIHVKEAGAWTSRPGGRRNSPVYVIAPGALDGDAYLALPPIFHDTPGMLAEALMRWRGPVTRPASMDYPPSPPMASQLYDSLAQGATRGDALVIRHGRGWLSKGPYATFGLGLSMLLSAILLAAQGTPLATLMVPLAAGALLCLMLPGWVGLTYRHVAPRRGVALVITPSEVLMRTRAGVIRTAFRNLRRVSVQSRRNVSLLEGVHQSRILTFDRKQSGDIRYEEAFLGMPAEVAHALIEAQFRGPSFLSVDAR